MRSPTLNRVTDQDEDTIPVLEGQVDALEALQNIEGEPCRTSP